jgi:hypothetical protein
LTSSAAEAGLNEENKMNVQRKVYDDPISDDTLRTLRMQYAGAIAFIAEQAVSLRGAEQDDVRETIERILDDAVAIGTIQSWRRTLNRFDIN